MDSVYDLTEAEREKLVPVDTIGRYYEDPEGITSPESVAEYNKYTDELIKETFNNGCISLFPDLVEEQKKQLIEHTKIVPVWFSCTKEPDAKNMVMGLPVQYILTGTLQYRYMVPKTYDKENFSNDVKDKIRRSISDRGCSWDNLMTWLPGFVYGACFASEEKGGIWYKFINEEIIPLKRYFEVLCKGELHSLDAMPIDRYQPVREGEYSLNDLVLSQIDGDGSIHDQSMYYKIIDMRAIGVFGIIAYMFEHYCYSNNISLHNRWSPSYQ